MGGPVVGEVLSALAAAAIAGALHRHRERNLRQLLGRVA
jgi:hypothetical protein